VCLGRAKPSGLCRCWSRLAVGDLDPSHVSDGFFESASSSSGWGLPARWPTGGEFRWHNDSRITVAGVGGRTQNGTVISRSPLLFFLIGQV
jgi:hypothetical protein